MRGVMSTGVMSTGVGETVASRREVPTTVRVAGNAIVRRGNCVMPAKASAEMAAPAKIAASAKMSATAHGVTTTSEMAAPGSVPATAAATATAAPGMLRPGESRRSRYRHAQQQGADGSHYISHARVGHDSSPLCSATGPLLRAPAGLSIRRLAAIPVQARTH
jgi:hypothetical protein